MPIFKSAFFLLSLLQVDIINSLTEEEKQLVKMLTHTYTFDYQILLVEDNSNMIDVMTAQQRFTQIIYASNMDNLFGSFSRSSVCGYFIFLNNDLKTRDLLGRVDPGMFRNNTWFIRTHGFVDDFKLSLKFDSDINFIQSSSEGNLAIYENYKIENQVMKTKFATHSYAEGKLIISSSNKHIRRQNLYGLSLRYIFAFVS